MRKRRASLQAALLAELESRIYRIQGIPAELGPGSSSDGSAAGPSAAAAAAGGAGGGGAPLLQLPPRHLGRSSSQTEGSGGGGGGGAAAAAAAGHAGAGGSGLGAPLLESAASGLGPLPSAQLPRRPLHRRANTTGGLLNPVRVAGAGRPGEQQYPVMSATGATVAGCRCLGASAEIRPEHSTAASCGVVRPYAACEWCSKYVLRWVLQVGGLAGGADGHLVAAEVPLATLVDCLAQIGAVPDVQRALRAHMPQRVSWERQPVAARALAGWLSGWLAPIVPQCTALLWPWVAAGPV